MQNKTKINTTPYVLRIALHNSNLNVYPEALHRFITNTGLHIQVLFLNTKINTRMLIIHVIIVVLVLICQLADLASFVE